MYSVSIYAFRIILRMKSNCEYVADVINPLVFAFDTDCVLFAVENQFFV